MPTKTLALLCCALLLAPDAFAAAYAVSSNSDVGVSTLRDALTNASGDALSLDVVSFSIPAQTLSPASPYAAVAKSAGAGLTINAPATTVISSPGSNVFTFTGAGLFTLTGLRTDGIIALGNHAVLAGSVGLNNGGSITTSGSETVSANVNLSGTGGSLVTGGISTFETYTGALSGSAALTADGGGTLDLTGATNAATGGILVQNATTLKVSAASQMGTGTVVLSGGSSLDTTTGITMSQTLNTLGGTIMTNSGATTSLNGSITGGSLVAAGPGTLDLGASSNAGLGFVKVTGGVLKVAADSALGTSDLILAGGALDATTGISMNRNLNLQAASTIKTNVGATTSLNGTILGGGVLTFAGLGTLDMRNDTVSSLGGVTVTGGTVKVSDDNQLGGNLILNGGALDTTTGIASSRSLNLAGAGTILANSGATTSLSGTISGTGLLTVAGSGTLDLTGATNNATGGDAITGGSAVKISAASQLGSGALTLNDGQLQTTANLTATQTVNIGASGGTFNVVTAGQTASFSGTLGGAGAVTKSGAGTLALTGSTMWTGDTAVGAGTLDFNQTADVAYGGAISGGGTVAKDGANTLTLSGNISGFSGPLQINAGTLSFAQTADTTYAGAISGAGAIAVNAANKTVTLSNAANSYTGDTALNAGTLSVSDAGQLGGSANLNFNGGNLRTTADVTLTQAVTFAGAGAIDVENTKTTLSGGISGANPVTLSGPGILSLTGSNMYAGGTTINAGTLDFAQSAGITYGGMISGAGAVSVSAAGQTIEISNAGNNYTGGTTVNAGSTLRVSADAFGAGGLVLNGATLQAGNDFSSARAVTLSGGSTFDTNFNTLSLSGAIGGAGGLTVTGTGRLALSGVNTYGGGTTVTGGTTLRVDGDAALGDGAGALTLDASTLQTTAALSSARSLIMTGASTIDTNGFDSTYSGNSSGAGDVTKTGVGTLTMSGANAYTGLTTVSQGTVNLTGSLAGAAAVNSGAILTGNGTVGGDLTNSGTVKPAGTLTVNGNYTGNSGSSLSIVAGTSRLAVTGSSTLDGTLAVTNKPANGNYVVLTSAGGITGTFASITGLSGMTIVPTYALDSLTLNILTSSTFGETTGLSKSQSGIAAALDRASRNSTPELDALIAKLQALSSKDLAKTFDQMSPSGAGAALGGMSFAGAGAHAGAVGQRMVGLRQGGADGAQSAYFAVSPARQPYPGLLLASAPGDTENYPPASPAASKWGVFASGVGNFGRLDARTDAGGTTPGFSFSAGGATVGADYRFNDNFIGGATLGYTDNVAVIDGGNGSVQGRAMRYGLYGTLFNEEWHGSLYLGGANDAYDATRNMTALGLTATSKPHAQEFNADATVGYDQPLDYGILFSPFAELAYDRVMTGSYAESGAGAMNLNVNRFVLQSQRSTIGAQFSAKTKAFGREVKPYVSLAESHEFENQGRSIVAQYASGGAFVSQTADASRDGAAVGAGLRAELGRGVSSKLGYLGDFRPGFRAHTINGELRYRF